MKVLLLCWRDTDHPQGGGSERYLEHVARYLVEQGHEVVFRTSKPTDSPRWAVRDGVMFSRGGGKLGVYPQAAVLMMLGRLGLGPLRGVDVVVDTQNGIPFFARLFSGRPTVLLTHHCHREQWPVAGKVLARVGWFIESKISPRVHRSTPVVTVSVPSAQELVDLGFPASGIEIIRNGVDPVPAVIPQLGDDGKLHVVTLSRLVPHKQIEHAIDAVADLDDVVLDVIGSGWWGDRLRQYAQARGARQVVFHGQVTEDYKHALLARAAVHVMPSRKEGWGLAVLEAAQHEVPTIGYRSSGGLQDSIEDGVTGVLVSNSAELRRKLRLLLVDAPLRHRLGAAAAIKAQGYSWEETGRRFLHKLNHAAAMGTAHHKSKRANPRR
ncbi:MAG: glycosyltransferase family 4 protein [Corynebacterium sp.]|uniref:glycosyltransferase family 4 protein n=1 Tax=Corynebacterium sp. TaxID=1720 RepID=UPI0026DC2229|nr:glycosyltransferase family 4 protein [Corynebacterium sp.]MDO5097525.1 glycosyltransferase family 4 protein [Corynebacterium sp.]